MINKEIISCGGRWLMLLVLCCMCLASLVGAHPIKKLQPGTAAPIPKFLPARAPVVTGEFVVGVVNIAFRETVPPDDLSSAIRSLNRVTDTTLESAGSSRDARNTYTKRVNQDEYFKTYSNGISWPKLVLLPNEKSYYRDANFYGYYCEFDVEGNPQGWKTPQEGTVRMKALKQRAWQFAAQNYCGTRPRFTCCNYMTSRGLNPDKKLTDAVFAMFPKVVKRSESSEKGANPASLKGDVLVLNAEQIWEKYEPACRWGDPLWPNASMQINDFKGGVLAHEIGHCLGAPDVYRVGRYNDGILGEASLLSYGPTANSFSRYYHHAFIKEQNHPTIRESGTYTLHPRHRRPSGSEALGYLIPSNHPHYMYHVEYIYQENDTVGVGPDVEGMLISVVNLGLENYLGSPDYFYVYRPGDPFFRGKGQLNECLFGEAHGREEFSMQTEPSSRLPNLLDGGVVLKNIREKGGTLTFDVSIKNQTLTGKAYTESMLPQIRLDLVTNIQATSFTMDCTIKFRGEPVKTSYGFCWSTTKNPTVNSSTYRLAHRECYRGHALHLMPATTYFVRAFATNGLGIRYSDEEITVKTAAVAEPPAQIDALLTDSFSQSRALSFRYNFRSVNNHADYSLICSLAKFIGYYRPEKFPSLALHDFKKSVVDFNQMHWKPRYDDPPARLLQVNGFFHSLYQRAFQLRLHEVQPGSGMLEKCIEITGVKSKPVMTEIKQGNITAVADMIRADLRQSRPVFMLIAKEHSYPEHAEPVRWLLIHGMNEEGKFYVDVPYGVALKEEERVLKFRTGYYELEKCLFQGYQTHVISSCYFTGESGFVR